MTDDERQEKIVEILWDIVNEIRSARGHDMLFGLYSSAVDINRRLMILQDRVDQLRPEEKRLFPQKEKKP